MEPTANDIAAVQATLPTEPVAQPQAPAPEPQAPATPAPQETISQPAPVATPPAPAELTDPFQSLFSSEPTQPAQPTEPSQTPQPIQTPVEPSSQPAAQAPATPEPVKFKTYDEYMDEVLAKVPKAPEAPDPNKVNADNPEDVKAFFDNMFTAAEARIEAKIERKNAIQTAEKKVWEDAFKTYPTLKTNQKVRDMVHNIRMGYFQRGVAITPSQAAKELVDSLGSSYKQGIADNQVVTTIQQVQPQGGASTPVSTSLDKQDVMTAVQTGGEQALMNILDAEVKAGRL